MTVHSLIVIGAGPGGYAAALEGAQRGLQVTLIDALEMGGTCLNRGCIPSKFLLSRAKSGHSSISPLAQILEQKNAVVSTLRQRMEQGAKAAKIRRLTGQARLISDHEVEVTTATGPERVHADSIILATGTAPVAPALFPSHPAIFTSDTIFSIDYLPAHLVVVGGGYIGSELACAFQGLGSKVTLIEKEKSLLATQPEFQAAAPVIQRAFEKRGMTLWTGTEVLSVSPSDTHKVQVACSNGETVEANAVLLALGRRSNLQTLGLDSAKVAVQNGRMTVNAFGQTSVPSLYAIGDLVSPLPLAHTAAKEAEVAVQHLLGETVSPLAYSSIPRCVYTSPETAFVGMTEAQAQAQGHKTRVDRYHFAGSAKAMIEGETEGFWMILSDAETHAILGALIVGPHATELIHLISLSLRAKLTTHDIADTVFAHPSLAEGFHEAMKRATVASARQPKP